MLLGDAIIAYLCLWFAGQRSLLTDPVKDRAQSLVLIKLCEHAPNDTPNDMCHIFATNYSIHGNL